jgi:copper chaperone NosL
MKRREIIRRSIAAFCAAGAGSSAMAEQHPKPADAAQGQAVSGKPVDAAPHVNDIEKFPKCNYCGMDRRRFHHSRMLLHYLDDSAEGVCSLRCAATSLALNLGRGTRAIWVGDNASPEEAKPLTDAEKASYLIGSSIRGVMTRRSKVAYSSVEAAEASKGANGGEIVDFDKALLAAYADIAEAVAMSRKNREERMQRMQKKEDR